LDELYLVYISSLLSKSKTGTKNKNNAT